MYERFFGLRERPFELTPNPRYLYLTGKHREALSNLQYGISARKGITLLVGEAGTGKTTILRAAIDALAGPSLGCAYVSNPVLTRAEFYDYLAPLFCLSDEARASKARFLSELEKALVARQRAGGTTALIVDEAQSLPRELMEEVRLLGNFETSQEKLLQVVMAGQPELAARLEHEDLRQLKQRVALRCDLLPLDVRETAAYVAGRIAIAGGVAARVFTREAVQAIHEHSLGIPRTISVICDNAMITAFATGTAPINAATIIEVCRDFHLGAREEGEQGPRAPAPHSTPPLAAHTDTAAQPLPRTSPVHSARPPVKQGALSVTPSSAPAAGKVAQKGTPTPDDRPSHPQAVGETNAPEERLFKMFSSRKRFRFF